jgi:hypothetical protein
MATMRFSAARFISIAKSQSITASVQGGGILARVWRGVDRQSEFHSLLLAAQDGADDHRPRQHHLCQFDQRLRDRDQGEPRQAAGRAEWISRAFVTLYADFDFIELPVNNAHAVMAGEFRPVHKDPFDRVLAAQAVEEGLTLVTDDREMEVLGAKRVWRE